MRSLTKKYSYVSLKAVDERSKVLINDKTLRNYLSEAMAEGVVHDAGKGWYSSIPSPAGRT